MNKKLLCLPILLLGLAIVPTLNVEKDNSAFVEMGTDELVSGSKVNIKKQVVGEEGTEFDISDTYAQYGMDAEGNKYIRFATAVKGDIKTITYNRGALGNDAQEAAEIKVENVYEGIKSGENIYYYDGTTFTTDESHAGKYYWACYSAKLGTVDYQLYDFALTITIEDKEGNVKEGDTKVASYGFLVNEGFDVVKETNNRYMFTEYDENGNVVVKQKAGNCNVAYYGDTYGSAYQHVAIGTLLEEASTTYYAEATINAQSSFANGDWGADGNTMQGLAHVKSLSMGTPIGNNFVTSGIRGGGRSLVMNKWIDSNKRCDSLTTWLNDHISVDCNAKSYKVAVARNGNALYTFFNDKYIGGYVDNDYSNVPTKPGLYTNSYNGGVTTTFSNISALTGEEAVNKINSLFEGKVGLSTNHKSATYSGNWKINDSTEGGVNFDFVVNSSNAAPTHENTALATHLRYTGDFKVEGDFKFNTIGANGELAINLFKTDCASASRSVYAQFHTRFNDSSTFTAVAMDCNVESGYGLDPWHNGLSGKENYFKAGSSVHYELISTLNESSRTLTFKVTSNDDPSMTETFTNEISSKGSSGQNVANWNDEINVVFSSRAITGSWTNVKWTGMPGFNY